LTHKNAGSKAQRDRLRRKMLEDGATAEQVATEMALRWRYRPRQAWRHAWGYTQQDVAARYNRVLDSPDAPMTDKRISDYEAWPAGGVKPTLGALHILAMIYRTQPIKLIDQLDRESLTDAERIALRPAAVGAAMTEPGGTIESEPNYRLADRFPKPVPALPVGTPGGGGWANESSKHAALAEATNVGPMTLEELREDVIRLARVSGKLDVAPYFPQIMRARDQIYRLLDRRQHPRQSTDLYFLASVICGVVADAADCLGYSSAAVEHTRAALTYADIIGHNSLRVWCRTMQAWLAQSDGRPRRAVAFARAGDDYATSPASRVWLSSMEGQALALVGDGAGADAAFRTATQSVDLESQPDDLYDEIGGTFQYSVARIHRSMALGYLQTGLPADAIDAATKGIEVFAAGPAELRCYGKEASLQTELATAYVLHGQLDAAQAAIAPVLALPLNRRISWLGGDIRRFRRSLAQLSDQRSAEFQQLEAGAEEFVSTLLSKSASGAALG
jgi:hypothetical protein